jgi:hypothetical protein
MILVATRLGWVQQIPRSVVHHVVQALMFAVAEAPFVALCATGGAGAVALFGDASLRH